MFSVLRCTLCVLRSTFRVLLSRSSVLIGGDSPWTVCLIGTHRTHCARSFVHHRARRDNARMPAAFVSIATEAVPELRRSSIEPAHPGAAGIRKPRLHRRV